MSQVNHSESDGLHSRVDSGTPPFPVFNITRQLHCNTWRSQRRLLSYNGEDHSQNFNHIRNDPMQNNDSQFGIPPSQSMHNHFENRYFPVPSCVPYNLESIDGSYPSNVPHNLEGAPPYVMEGTQYENGQIDGFELSGVPCNLEGTPPYVMKGIQYESGQFDGFKPSGVPYNWEGIEQSFVGSSSGANWMPKPGNLEGLIEVICETDDDDDHTYFDTRTWKPLTISCQQWRVLEAISQRKSVFVTGSAGTGKSYLLKFAARVLFELHGPSSVFVTASTGIAACELKGRTLHSFAGVKLGVEPAGILALIVRNSPEAFKRWESANALIIDEISMIDGEFLDKLEYVARRIRGTNQVFGGLQLVVTGDFFQLPPVKANNLSRQFAFEADCWHKCFDMQIELKQVFRQADNEFIDMLEEIRKAHCSPRTISRLSSCIGLPIGTDDYGIAPTRLFPRKVEVRRYNDRELMALNKEIVPFRARDEGPEKSLLNNGVAPKELHLCEGAQVILIWNIDVKVGLVNGARGVVVGFTFNDTGGSLDISPKGLWPVVQFHCRKKNMVIKPVVWEVNENDSVVASRRQVPLILAWALSVHKCQGMTLDRVETDLSKAFEYGMVYVALSRIKNLEGLRLTGFDPQKIRAHPKVFDFYESFTEQKDETIMIK